MGALSTLVDSVETTFGIEIEIEIVSGGNSANLAWAFSTPTSGRVNNLRLGEAILLGREPLHRHRIPGLHTDAFVLVAEVIESKHKPTKPWGQSGQNSFGEKPPDRGPWCNPANHPGLRPPGLRRGRPVRPRGRRDPGREQRPPHRADPTADGRWR